MLNKPKCHYQNIPTNGDFHAVYLILTPAGATFLGKDVIKDDIIRLINIANTTRIVAIGTIFVVSLNNS